jgi:5-methyltetrahydrofolate--homocysteine methyltransferase
MANIKEILKERILVLDGAMGTMIQRYTLDENDFRGERFKNHTNPLKGNNDILSITRPDIIKNIHLEYLNAGADILETNTFSANVISQADYQLEDAVYDINFESARIAKEACDEVTKKNPLRPRFVAGSIGPTNRTASISPDVNRPGYRAVTFEDLKNAYIQQTEALIDGGVDILLVETIFDTLNAKAAVFGIQEVLEKRNLDIPIMISGTITDASGRTLSGQTTEAFLISLSHVPLLSIGLNCALGAMAMKQYIEILAKKSPFFVSCYPNAGLPNEMGMYDETPQDMEVQLEQFMQEGLINIVGGCCGTTPDHIERFAYLAQKYPPRKLNAS